MKSTERQLKKLMRSRKSSTIKQIKYARDLCFDEWINKYPHNKILMKSALLGMILVCILALVAVL